MLRLSPVCVILFFAVNTLPAAEPAPAMEREVVYATIGDLKLTLDMARPAGAGPHPLVVGFHGGAWKAGNKRDLSRHTGYDMGFGTVSRSPLEHLADEGYVAVSVGYRLAPANKWPAQAEDAKTAVRFLRANAAKFGIDPERVAALGFSAGGHLAALLGTTDKDAGLEGTLYPNQSSRVNCVVDFFGPADLSLYAESPGIEGAFMVPFLGKRYAVDPEVYRNASPLSHVSKGDSPFLILHGTADVIVPVIHSERLHAKLQAAGVASQLVEVKGKGHGWGGAAATESTATMLKFLADQLKAKK